MTERRAPIYLTYRDLIMISGLLGKYISETDDDERGAHADGLWLRCFAAAERLKPSAKRSPSDDAGERSDHHGEG